MSESEIASISKQFVAVNPKKNTDWALTIFQEWRSTTIPEGECQCQSDLLEKPDVDELTYWLSHFLWVKFGTRMESHICRKAFTKFSVDYSFTSSIAILLLQNLGPTVTRP